MLSMLTRRLLPLLLVAVLVSGAAVPAAAQGSRAAALRNAASELLGGAVESLADFGTAEPLDEAILPMLSSGAEALEQSLGSAVFAVPVAGNIGYVLRAQVYHDLSISFPPHWNIVQVFVGDPSRWRVTTRGSFVVVQPGEPGARTNLTAIFASGELVQIDLEELTGGFGLERTGRAYVGPEPWLVDRIFALMPADVRDAMLEHVAAGDVGVAELLADPVAAIRSQGVFAALPPESASLLELPLAPGGPVAPDPALADPTVAAPVAIPEPPTPAVPLLVPPDAPAPLPDSLRDRFAPSSPEPAPDRPILPLPRPIAPAGVILPPGARVLPVSLSSAAEVQQVFRVPPSEPEAPRLASADALAALEQQLAAAGSARDFARRAAGDRIARATLDIDDRIAALETDYPARVHFSLLLEPDIPPFTPPFWHLGVWHDGEYTYWRTLAEDPVFMERGGSVALSVLRLDDFLYRIDGVIEEGALIVPGPDQRPRHLYWRRREELESPP